MKMVDKTPAQKVLLSKKGGDSAPAGGALLETACPSGLYPGGPTVTVALSQPHDGCPT